MLFNYQTLKATLHRKERSVSVTLQKNFIDREMIFELESLFGWLARHIEVNALLLTSADKHFCSGLNRDEMFGMDEEALKKHLCRLQKMILALLHLPQTVICDLKEGAAREGVELSLGCDIRIAHKNASLKLDFSGKGLVPVCGTAELLRTLVGEGNCRSWLLVDQPISAEQLLGSGLLHTIYQDKGTKIISDLLQSTGRQSPLARVQTKRLLLENILPNIERSMQSDLRFCFANLKSGDWKKALLAEKSGTQASYTPANTIAQKLQGELRDH